MHPSLTPRKTVLLRALIQVSALVGLLGSMSALGGEFQSPAGRPLAGQAFLEARRHALFGALNRMETVGQAPANEDASIAQRRNKNFVGGTASSPERTPSSSLNTKSVH